MTHDCKQCKDDLCMGCNPLPKQTSTPATGYYGNYDPDDQEDDGEI